LNLSTFRGNLKTQLDVLAAYQTLGVTVFKYPPGALATTKPTLWFDRAQHSPEILTLVGDSSDTIQLTGGGYASGAGATDADWVTAEDNAQSLIDGLIAQLQTDPFVNSACTYAHVSAWTIEPSQDPDAKRLFMDLTFTINILVAG
jgi:hypothetical protein